MTHRLALLKKLHGLFRKAHRCRRAYLQRYDWAACARPNQRLPPGDWRIWLILAGRGFGKTRTGSETIKAWVKNKNCRRIALVGNTEQDVRQVMLEGESGLLNIYSREEPQPLFVPSLQRVTWPCGAVATLFSAESYEKLRGPQFDGAWVDELAKFRFPQETWDQLMLALRLGDNPRALVTTTPRPIPLLQAMLQDSMVTVTRGSTYDNAQNLAPGFLHQILKRYDQTQLGAQEIYGDLLSATEGALWQRCFFRYKDMDLGQMQRIVVAVDPAMTSHQASDETGIVVVGLGVDGFFYVLADLSARLSPPAWTKAILGAYQTYEADVVVVEVNQGGDMLEHMVRAEHPTICFKALHARRAKHIRAEPVVALYEQGRVYHVRPLKILEDQLCSYVPGQGGVSPDRLDALVWAISELTMPLKAKPRLWVP